LSRVPFRGARRGSPREAVRRRPETNSPARLGPDFRRVPEWGRGWPATHPRCGPVRRYDLPPTASTPGDSRSRSAQNRRSCAPTVRAAGSTVRPIRTAARTADERRAASATTCAPIECPIRICGPAHASATLATNRPVSARSRARRGRGESPKPGRSSTVTRCRAERTRVRGSSTRRPSPIPWTSTIGIPASVPKVCVRICWSPHRKVWTGTDGNGMGIGILPGGGCLFHFNVANSGEQTGRNGTDGHSIWGTR
jgi:hypothetical protein